MNRKASLSFFHLLFLLDFFCFHLSVTQAKDVYTYIKSMDSVIELPLSILTNERSKGSEIYKAYKKTSRLDIPSSPEEAYYFPIRGTSLDSIISFLQEGRINYDYSNFELLSKDVKQCKLLIMKSKMDIDVKEQRLMQGYPELRKLQTKNPKLYQQIILSLAVLNKDLDFLEYLISKYELDGMAMLENFSFKDTKYLENNNFPFNVDDLAKYHLPLNKLSILQIVKAVDSKQEKMYPYLVTIIRKDNVSIPNNPPKFELAAKKIKTSTGTSYRKIINNPILGKDAWLDISRGFAWSSIAKKKMNYFQAKEYCEEKLVTNPSSRLACTLPKYRDYKEIGEEGNKAYKLLPSFHGKHKFWTSKRIRPLSPLAMVFLAKYGYTASPLVTALYSVRCKCTLKLDDEDLF